MNPYEVLGLPRDASQEDIRKARQRLAAAVHPDRPGGSTARMAQVNKAYALIETPAARAHFDATGAAPKLQTADQRAAGLIVGHAERLLFSVEEHTDLVQLIREALIKQAAENDTNYPKACVEISNGIAKLEKDRKRLRYTRMETARNILDDLYQQQISGRQEARINLDARYTDACQTIARALQLLDDFGFETTTAVPIMPGIFRIEFCRQFR